MRIVWLLLYVIIITTIICIVLLYYYCSNCHLVEAFKMSNMFNKPYRCHQDHPLAGQVT